MIKAIGLTGNIGCGKSTVASMLAEHPDVAIHNSDELAKEIMTGEEYREKITEILGRDMFVPVFNKNAIAKIIFADPEKKKQLEELIHPLVLARIQKQIAESHGQIIQVVESALIYESQLENNFEEIVVVSCNESEQRKRLEDYRTMSSTEIQARIDSQISPIIKERKADYIIRTDCSRLELRKRVARLYNYLKAQKENLNEKRVAVYAGTFDPPTSGHWWMIEQAANLFDEVIVAIGVNPDKKPLFSLEERLNMLRKITSQKSNIRVASFPNQYLINYATSEKANFIVRGVRNAADFEWEKVFRNINSDFGKDITSIFLIPPREFAEISSSTIKGLVGPEGWEKVVKTYLPEAVWEKVLSKRHTLWQNLKEAGAQGQEEELWQELLSRYTEKERYYHNWEHICAMLNEFYQIKHLLKDSLSVEMAIWYHDAVYDPKADDNEEKSALLAKNRLLALGLPEELIKRVEKLIMKTKYGCAKRFEDGDTSLFLDLDLTILGKEQPEYDIYANNVRREYQWLDQDSFRRGRSAVLLALKSRLFIYRNEYFEQKYGSRAFSNIVDELKKLNT